MSRTFRGGTPHDHDFGVRHKRIEQEHAAIDLGWQWLRLTSHRTGGFSDLAREVQGSIAAQRLARSLTHGRTRHKKLESGTGLAL